MHSDSECNVGESMNSQGTEGQSPSLVGARRMMFEKIVTEQADSTTPVKSKRRPASFVEGYDNVAQNSKGHHRQDRVSRTSSRISLRTIPLNDHGRSENDNDELQIEKDTMNSNRSYNGSRSSSESCGSPERLEDEPSAMVDNPAFTKRISYHNAVFKNPELVLPKPKCAVKEEPCIAEEVTASSSSSESPQVVDTQKEKISSAAEDHQETDDEKMVLRVLQVPQIKEEEHSTVEEKHSSAIEVTEVKPVIQQTRTAEENQKKSDEKDQSDLGLSCSKSELSCAANSSRRTESMTSDVDYPQELNPFGDEEEQAESSAKDKSSLNPFGSDSEFEDEPISNKSTNISTNPFGSDSEDEELNTPSPRKAPVPLPRSCNRSRNSLNLSPQPSPRRSVAAQGNALNQLSPVPAARKLSDGSVESNVSPCSSSANSTLRKKKPAPPPPPFRARNEVKQKAEVVAVAEPKGNGKHDDEMPKCDCVVAAKTNTSQWKNKKGPAPARPTPVRRPVKEMPLEDIKIEISDVEVRQLELERQGVQLEQMIREKTETESADSPAVDEMMLQLFELVNEKNELFRRRSELINMRKMHLLEEEHSELEYQIRCLMLKPPSNKTDTDKENEEQLIKKLLEVVEKRNAIIEKMENDRQRETAEDYSVTTQLDNGSMSPDKKKDKKAQKNKKDKAKDEDKMYNEKHSPGQLIKKKLLTLKHSTKKLHSKAPN